MVVNVAQAPPSLFSCYRCGQGTLGVGDGHQRISRKTHMPPPCSHNLEVNNLPFQLPVYFIGSICSSSRNTRTASKQISHMTTSQHQSGNGSVSQNSVSGAISRVSRTKTSVYPHRRNWTQFSHGSEYKSVFLAGTQTSVFLAGCN